MQAYLLDIEGTCAPVAFVYETLFPYARKNLETFLENNSQSSEVVSAISLLEKERALDVSTGRNPPEESILQYCLWLMDQDRKSTGLKALQGMVWKKGFLEGELTADIYPDVVPAIKRWKDSGKGVYIYSSGSVQAQKLLFSHTQEGDLSPLLDGYFDTTTGPKKESRSYRLIQQEIGVSMASEIHFLSDCPEEIAAARGADLQASLVVRDATPNGRKGLRDFTTLT